MRVLVDTTVWSLLLRRRRKELGPRERAIQLELKDLVTEGRAVLAGPIRQELLTGVKTAKEFDRLREHLRHFPDEPLTIEDHEEAARCANLCRAKGVSGSPVDFLLCALGSRGDLAVFTLDEDFLRYQEHLELLRIHGVP